MRKDVIGVIRSRITPATAIRRTAHTPRSVFTTAPGTIIIIITAFTVHFIGRFPRTVTIRHSVMVTAYTITMDTFTMDTGIAITVTMDTDMAAFISAFVSRQNV